MPLTPETQARINTQSMAYWGRQKAGPCAKQRYEAYKEGRTDEAERAQKLMDLLAKIRDMTPPKIDLVREITDTLTEHHQP
jgi:hypothetical protein